MTQSPGGAVPQRPEPTAAPETPEADGDQVISTPHEAGPAQPPPARPGPSHALPAGPYDFLPGTPPAFSPDAYASPPPAAPPTARIDVFSPPPAAPPAQPFGVFSTPPATAPSAEPFDAFSPPRATAPAQPFDVFPGPPAAAAAEPFDAFSPPSAAAPAQPLGSFPGPPAAAPAEPFGVFSGPPPAAPAGPIDVFSPPPAAPPAQPFDSLPGPPAVPSAEPGGAFAGPPAPPAAGPAARRRRPAGRGVVFWAAVGALLVALLAAVQVLRPLPDPTLKLVLSASHTFPGTAPQLPWPTVGQAAVEVEGLGAMGSSGGRAPTPTASVAKVMTAYVFLKNHELAAGEQGPSFAISAEEAARLPELQARQETHVEVFAGQRFTQRKALEALLIVSANNIAHELARWDAGGDVAYVAKMNAAARGLGMTDTVYTDPSGYDSATVSTASDQVKLLRAAMRIPSFASVVAMRAYTPPDGGAVRRAGNALLGRFGVVGGKTGFTDAAGGNYVFAARRTVGGVSVLIVGAVMGQRGATTPQPAIDAAQRLITTAEGSLTSVTLARRGDRVAQVDDGLGGRTPLTAARPVNVTGWPGLTVRLSAEGKAAARGSAGDRLGAVAVGSGPERTRTELELATSMAEPSLPGRLLRLG